MLTILFSLAAFGMAPQPPATFSDAVPPPEFQQDRAVTLRAASREEIRRTCEPLYGRPPAGRRTWACEVDGAIIAPNPCDFPASDFYAQLLCHELGHAEGWPADHRGGTPLALARDRSRPALSRKLHRHKTVSVAARAKPRVEPAPLAPRRPDALALLEQQLGSGQSQP